MPKTPESMAFQSHARIEITLSEAFQGRAFLNDNPLINKLRKLPFIGEKAYLFDPFGAFVYSLKTSDGKIIALGREARDWLFNYLHRDIVATLQLQIPIPITLRETVRYNQALHRAKQVPVPEYGAPSPKVIRKKRRKKVKKVLDILSGPDIVGPVSTNCD